MVDPTSRPVVIVSNRGPLSFRRRAGDLLPRRGSGGLVSGLAPLVETGDANWIAAALSEADREAIDVDGVARGVGLEVRMVDLDAELHRRYYDDISNSTLWFAHHGLYDRVRAPAYDADWWTSWEAYREVNRRFADEVVTHAPQHAIVLVQDYHLTLVALGSRPRRPDLSFVHFHHTPFAGPADLEVLPPRVRSELLRGLAAHDACGFHTERWAANYLACRSNFATGDGERLASGHAEEPDSTAAPARTFAATLNSDLDDLAEVARSAECVSAGAELDARLGDDLLIGRVDRMELSKNIVRGFDAFDRLLERRPDLRGRVVFMAACYPSRLGVEDYRRYHDEVVAAAARVNRRWGTDDHQPVDLMTEDDFARSVALLQRYDVLLVNPIRDGLNLVAKEGPAVNLRDGSLVLSTEAGSFTELGDAVDAVFPFDIEATSSALEAAVDRGPADRAERSARLRNLVAARTPADWLADQLAAVDLA